MGYLPCYCSSQLTQNGFSSMDEEFPISGKTLCKDWITSYGITNGLMLGTIIFISVFNLILSYLLTALSKFERSHSLTTELASNTLKIMISQFVNSVFELITLGISNLFS